MTLEKITRAFGFDTKNKANGKQNSYAWAMEEFGDYIYVGTGRNIGYEAFLKFGYKPPKEFIPENYDPNTEIWRYKKGNGGKIWEKVYKAPSELQMIGIRDMIAYTDKHGKKGIYCTIVSKLLNQSFIIYSYDGINWDTIKDVVPAGFNSRAMAIHNNKLYIGMNTVKTTSNETYLFASDDPASGFTQINMNIGSGEKITGEIDQIVSYNGYLYIGTAPIGGFSVWKSNDLENGNWKLVIDKGAGDELNEIPVSMTVFNDNIYIGTGIWYAVRSIDPAKKIVPIKGFDIIKLDKEDKWEVIVGSEPLLPTNPTTGKRNKGIYQSGFGNIFNDYCWQLHTYNNKLYVSTFESAIIWKTMAEWLFEGKEEELVSIYVKEMLEKYKTNPNFKHFNVAEWVKALLTSIKKYPKDLGFDFLVTKDGKDFETLAVRGFGNIHNYGIRTLLSAKDGYLYIGTANPYDGCEVWKLFNCKH